MLYTMYAYTVSCLGSRKDLEHGEEVNVKKERTKNRTMSNTMGDIAGGVECELILTVEERLEM